MPGAYGGVGGRHEGERRDHHLVARDHARGGVGELEPYRTVADGDGVGDGIWMSPGLSNSYLLVGERDHTIINTGMGFEGPLHQRAYAGLAVGEPHSIIFTQGHYDHVGGVDVLRGPGTEVIAQRNFDVWRADNERLESFRSRNAAFAWIDAILAAMSYADSLGVGNVAQARPNPTHLIDEDETLDAGGRAVRAISVPGGETTDALVLWLEDSRTAFTGNLTGPCSTMPSRRSLNTNSTIGSWKASTSRSAAGSWAMV